MEQNTSSGGEEGWWSALWDWKRVLGLGALELRYGEEGGVGDQQMYTLETHLLEGLGDLFRDCCGSRVSGSGLSLSQRPPGTEHVSTTEGPLVPSVLPPEFPSLHILPTPRPQTLPGLLLSFTGSGGLTSLSSFSLTPVLLETVRGLTSSSLPVVLLQSLAKALSLAVGLVLGVSLSIVVRLSLAVRLCLVARLSLEVKLSLSV